MKRALSDAAKELDLHPANLMLEISGMGAEFEDIWPQIDETWTDTVKQQDWEKFGYDVPLVDKAGESRARQGNGDLGVSESAVEARLHRARKRLRAELTALNVIEVRS